MIASVPMNSINQISALEKLLDGVAKLPWATIAGPLVAAEDALARLDERLRSSPVREGWIARSHVRDVVACIWVSGELVTIEDLVLRDAGMDVRTPSAVLSKAQEILRVRRRLAGGAGASVLSREGLDALLGQTSTEYPPVETGNPSSSALFAGDDGLRDALSRADVAVAEARAVLGRIEQSAQISRNPLVYDLDWNEGERLQSWFGTIGEFKSFPPVLSSVLALCAWDAIEPLQHQSWLGRFLAAAMLRERDKARAHLPCLYSGLRVSGRGPRRPETFLAAIQGEIKAVEAAARDGLKEHDRLMLARLQFDQRLKGRRSTSRLPELVEFVLETPLISTALVARKLRVSQRAAQDLILGLGLRELTGRERYRAWGIV